MDSLHTLYDFSEKEEQQDQWDEMISANTDLFHYLNMAPNFNITFRLLGPFLPARRIYLSPGVCDGYITSIKDLKSIILGKSELIEKVIAKVDADNAKLTPLMSKKDYDDDFGRARNKKGPNEKALQLSSLKSFLSRCLNERQWKPCMLVNALVISSHNEQSIGCIKIFSISPDIMFKLHETCIDRFGSIKVKINGLLAYNIILSSNRGNNINERNKVPRQEFGVMTDDNVRLSDFPSMLPNESIGHIVRDGIFDIKKVIKEHNKKKLNNMFGYFFKVSESYKASEEMMKPIIDEAKYLEEKQQYDLIDNLDRNSLPKEAFDDVEEITNPVMDMEL